MYTANIYITLKPTVNDPQGQTVLGSLRRMGYAGAESVRVGKLLQVRLDASNQSQAAAQVEEMCQKLLANPIIEDYHFELEESATKTPAS
jgi:phosphoribosylformylglycinamidine synthase